MKITHVETIPYNIPYLTPLEFASGQITAVENVLVRIHTDAGIIGQAEAPARPYIYGESQQSIIRAIHDWFIPSLQQIDLLNVEQSFHAMRWVQANQTARAAVDLAIWDAIGQHYSLPCHKLLGGWGQKIQASHMLGFNVPGKVVEEALAIQERWGITTFKVKTGKNLQRDIQTCKALRQQLPAASFYLDANHGWKAMEAIFAARVLKDEGFLFFEEPSPASDRAGRRKLNQVLPLPVCGDESCTTLEEVAQEIADGIASFICIKTARTGFTESAKIANLCEGLQVPVYIGNQGDTQVGTMASVQFACAKRHTSQFAAELTNFLEISDDLIANPLTIIDGMVQASNRPGIGVEIDEEKLQHYRCD